MSSRLPLRHHADIGHAYDVLKSGQFDPANIITMVYDDIPTLPQNPFQGTMFNAPSNANGIDVWTNIKDNIDYSGEDVNSENFVKALTGVSVNGRKVINSGPEDNIFIFYSDHGASGIVAMPGRNAPLTVKTLKMTLLDMSLKKKFKNLVFYLEACESGSMFDGWLDEASTLNIWAVTAANPTESSWGWYCPPTAVNGQSFSTCLGDEFSIGWMESVDSFGSSMTLADHYEYLKAKVGLSHVTLYGNRSMGSMTIGEFINAPGYVRPTPALEDGTSSVIEPRALGGIGGLHYLQKSLVDAQEQTQKARETSLAIDSRDIKLATDYTTYMDTKESSLEEKLDAGRTLMNEVRSRLSADLFFSKLVTDYFGAKRAPLVLHTKLSAPAISCGECCEKAYEAIYSASCNGFTDYSLKYAHVFQAICQDSSVHRDIRDIADHLSFKIKSICVNPPRVSF